MVIFYEDFDGAKNVLRCNVFWACWGCVCVHMSRQVKRPEKEER